MLSAAANGGPLVFHLSDCDTDWDYLTAADFLIAAAGLRGGLVGSLLGGGFYGENIVTSSSCYC